MKMLEVLGRLSDHNLTLPVSTPASTFLPLKRSPTNVTYSRMSAVGYTQPLTSRFYVMQKCAEGSVGRVYRLPLCI